MEESDENREPKPVAEQSASEAELWLPISEDAAIIKTDTQVDNPAGEADLPAIGDYYDPPDGMQRLQHRTSGLLARPLDIGRAALAQEIEKGAAFLWAPVFFGTGCLCYFTLPREPLLFAFPVLAAVMLMLAWRIGRGHWMNMAVLSVALFAAGATAGQVRSKLVNTNVLAKTGVGKITGRVMKAEYRPDGSARYTLDVTGPETAFEFRGTTTFPQRIRLTARKGSERARVGDLLKGRARMGPPPGPAFPGGYDFSFQIWFNGIGASGFFLGKPEIVAEVAPVQFSWSQHLAAVRGKISGLIRQALPGSNGGLASALIVGDRSGIDRETADGLRHSGLAHILAISGLHMALVSATVIFIMRAIFALFPAVSLNYPTRKWACALALMVASGYLLLSGASVSTRRAYIMIAIMLLAVLCDRRALTMRNVALAALLVLFMAPESILSPGFQMSFAAVAALVATYEIVTQKQVEKRNAGRVATGGMVSRFLVKDMGGLALTSLVAGVATSLFAAYHFQRVAPMGLAANLLAMPLVTFAVMPLALLSVLAMPFALEAVPLALMGLVLDWVVSIANWASNAGPAGFTGIIPAGALIFGSLALLAATLSRTRLKLLALPLLVPAVLVLAQRDYPSIVILENGNQLGVVTSKDGLRLLRPNGEKFSTSMWRGAFDPTKMGVGAVKPSPRGQPGAGFSCDEFGCSTEVEGAIITHIRNTANLMDDCRLSDVIVVPYTLQKPCHFLAKDQRPLIMDRSTMTRYGAATLFIPTGFKAEGRSNKITIRHAYGANPRPWTQHRFAGRLPLANQ